MKYVNFKKMSEVYKYLIAPTSMGLYNPSRGLYVDVYNEEGALASYLAVPEEAKEAERNRRYNHESSWAPFLNKGFIHEDNGDLDDGNELLILCQQIKNEKGQWIYPNTIIEGEERYCVTMGVDATYEVVIMAPSEEEGKELAMNIAMEADFGVAENIDIEVISINVLS